MIPITNSVYEKLIFQQITALSFPAGSYKNRSLCITYGSKTALTTVRTFKKGDFLECY